MLPKNMVGGKKMFLTLFVFLNGRKSRCLTSQNQKNIGKRKRSFRGPGGVVEGLDSRGRAKIYMRKLASVACVVSRGL